MSASLGVRGEQIIKIWSNENPGRTEQSILLSVIASLLESWEYLHCKIAKGRILKNLKGNTFQFSFKEKHIIYLQGRHRRGARAQAR